jgi:hypothetical protein
MLKETADVVVALNLTPEQLNEKIVGADALIVRSATKVGGRLLRGAGWLVGVRGQVWPKPGL